MKCACGADKYSVEYFEAYGVVLCRDCKKNDPLINKVSIRNFAPISVVGETDAPRSLAIDLRRRPKRGTG